ncbi:hypothetical protein LCGC14_0911120 [marine sediment metagenome]|uniref:Uncharacterized protein n=1 Tax=marine sediment metagenome TaxID=412755 RepID=A0A0F9RCL3_9ZZZZ|nr:hypothetical protein [Candidatus Aminicenantes bacterium]
MKGKLTINEDEIKVMVGSWLKGNVFPERTFIQIDSIESKSYGIIDLEVEFSSAPIEQKGGD